MQIDQNGIYVSGIKQNISYPDTGNNNSFNLEKDSFWFNHRNEVIFQVMLKYPHKGNFADIGGGNGYQAASVKSHFPEKEVFLIEPGYEGCLNAKKYGLKNVYNMLSQHFDFIGNKIGGIGLFDVIEHINDDIGFLKQLSASVEKGTLIYITVPTYNWLWSDTDNVGGHFRRFDTKMVKQLAKKSGLKLIYSSYFMFYLPLPILLLRALPYKIRGVREINIIEKVEKKSHIQSRIVSPVLKLINRLEIRALRGLGRISAGASIICVLQT